MYVFTCCLHEYYTLWFLKSLIILILITPLIWLLLKNHSKKFPTGLLALVIIVIAYRYGWIKIGSEIFYFIGAYIGLNLREQLFIGCKGLSILSTIIIIVQLGAIVVADNRVLVVLFAVSLWFFLDFWELESVSLPWWMSITFFIYVSHDMFLEAMEKIFLKVFGISPIMAILDYCLMPFLTLGVAILVSKVLQLLCPAVWKLVTGSR